MDGIRKLPVQQLAIDHWLSVNQILGSSVSLCLCGGRLPGRAATIYSSVFAVLSSFFTLPSQHDGMWAAIELRVLQAKIAIFHSAKAEKPVAAAHFSGHAPVEAPQLADSAAYKSMRKAIDILIACAKLQSFFDNIKCFSSWCRVRGSSPDHGRRPTVDREPRGEQRWAKSNLPAVAQWLSRGGHCTSESAEGR
jgi:hypothetical protein